MESYLYTVAEVSEILKVNKNSVYELGVRQPFMVRPDRAYILAGVNPVKVRFSKSLCIES